MIDQLLLKFPNKKNYLKEDFYVSSSNNQAFDIINTWPKWLKKNINIFGPSGSGKSHLVSFIEDKAPCVKTYGANISEKVFSIMKGIDLVFHAEIPSYIFSLM